MSAACLAPAQAGIDCLMREERIDEVIESLVFFLCVQELYNLEVLISSVGNV